MVRPSRNGLLTTGTGACTAGRSLNCYVAYSPKSPGVRCPLSVETQRCHARLKGGTRLRGSVQSIVMFSDQAFIGGRCESESPAGKSYDEPRQRDNESALHSGAMTSQPRVLWQGLHVMVLAALWMTSRLTELGMKASSWSRPGCSEWYPTVTAH